MKSKNRTTEKVCLFKNSCIYCKNFAPFFAKEINTRIFPTKTSSTVAAISHERPLSRQDPQDSGKVNRPKIRTTLQNSPWSERLPFHKYIP
jgi:hypothetical protein